MYNEVEDSSYAKPVLLQNPAIRLVVGVRVMPEERRPVRTELAAATGLGKWMRLSKCLTVEETAAVLRIVPGTLRQWVRKGTGPQVTRINGCLRFRDDHIQEFIDQHADERAA